MNYAAVTKAKAMYGRRLTAPQIDALTECAGITELAEALKAHPAYKDAFADSETRDMRIERLELLLRKQYWMEFDRLAGGLDDSERQSIKRFAGLYELRFILTALRGGALHAMYLPLIKKYSELDFDAIMSAQSAQDVADALPEKYRGAVSPAIKDGGADILAAENALWKVYTAGVSEHTGKRRDRELEALTGTEADMGNVLRIFRLREYFRYTAEEIMPYLLSPLYRLNEKQTAALCGADGDKGFRTALRETAYKRLAAAKDGRELERSAQGILAAEARRTLHFGQSTAAVIYAYLILKSRETDLVRSVAESIRYDMSREMIKDYVGTKTEADQSYRSGGPV